MKQKKPMIQKYNKIKIELFICEYFGVYIEDVRSRTRIRPYTLYRFILWKAIKELSGLSLVEIATQYGRDHSTIRSGILNLRYGKEKEMYDLFVQAFNKKWSGDKVFISGSFPVDNRAT